MSQCSDKLPECVCGEGPRLPDNPGANSSRPGIRRLQDRAQGGRGDRASSPLCGARRRPFDPPRTACPPAGRAHHWRERSLPPGIAVHRHAVPCQEQDPEGKPVQNGFTCPQEAPGAVTVQARPRWGMRIRATSRSDSPNEALRGRAATKCRAILPRGQSRRPSSRRSQNA